MSTSTPVISPKHRVPAMGLSLVDPYTLVALDTLVDIADAELSSSWQVYDRIKQLRASHKTYVGLLARYLAPLIQRIAIDNELPATVTCGHAARLVARHLAEEYVAQEW